MTRTRTSTEDALRQEKIIAAFSKSVRTFEDVINFLETAPLWKKNKMLFQNK